MATEDVTLPEIRILLDANFSLDEVHDLAFDLSLDTEKWPEGKSSIIRNLILELKRNQRLSELRTLVQNRKPFIVWPGTVPAKSPESQKLSLYNVLDTKFSMADIEEICFRLNIDFDTISGQDKKSKIRNLIAFFEHRDRLDELITSVREARPGIDV